MLSMIKRFIRELCASLSGVPIWLGVLVVGMVVIILLAFISGFFTNTTWIGKLVHLGLWGACGLIIYWADKRDTAKVSIESSGAETTFDWAARVWVPQLVAVLLLIQAVGPGNSYGYFVLLRWICCSVFLYLTFKAVESKQGGVAWILGTGALLYNPVFPPHLGKSIWTTLNYISMIVLAASVYFLRPTQKGKA